MSIQLMQGRDSVRILIEQPEKGYFFPVKELIYKE